MTKVQQYAEESSSAINRSNVVLHLSVTHFVYVEKVFYSIFVQNILNSFDNEYLIKTFEILSTHEKLISEVMIISTAASKLYIYAFRRRVGWRKNFPNIFCCRLHSNCHRDTIQDFVVQSISHFQVIGDIPEFQ